jgi:hypothetical protein
VGTEIVVECRNVAVLRKSDIDEACEKGRYPFFPKHLHLVIGLKTEVSAEVRAYAAEKHVEIKRLRV